MTGPTDKRLFLLSFFIAAILFAFFLLVFVPMFLTNDDVAMMMLASGTGHGMPPDEHLLFTNVILGLLFKKLYIAVPYFPWYGLFTFSVFFLSTLAILYATLKQKYSLTRLFFFLLFFITVELYFLVKPQFTFTAYMAGAGGIFLFLSAIEDERYLFPLFFALFLLVISSLIRINAFYMALLLGTPLLFMEFIRRCDKKVLIRYSAFFLSIIVLSTAFQYYNRAYYENDPSWRGFYEFNATRAEFIDYHKVDYTPETKHIFEEVGWSKNDFNMMMSWFIADSDVFSLAKLRTILSHFPSRKGIRRTSIQDFVRNEIRPGNVYIIFFALLSIFFFCYTRKDRLYILRVFTILGWIFVLMAYIFIYKYLKGRVYFSMISFLTLTTLFYADNDLTFRFNGLMRPEKIKRLLLLIFTVAVLFFQGHLVLKHYRFSQLFREWNLQFKRSILKLKPAPHRLFVVWANKFPYDLILPFDNVEYLSDLRLLGIGVGVRTPFAAKIMDEFGIANLYTDLCNRENVFLISNRTRNLLYRTYMKEHYGLDVTFSYYYYDRNLGLTVYRVECV